MKIIHLHGKVLKHFIYTLDGSIIQAEVALGLNHVIVVWFEPSCYQVQPTQPITSIALMV